MTALNLDQLRRRISYNKRWDFIFVILGLISVSIGIITMIALTVQLFVQGWPRLSWQFITSFPSSFPEEAGALVAWVGSILVMLVTAVTSIPLGVAAGIYLEEYGKKNWLAGLIEVNVTNLAGVPSIVYGLLAAGLFVEMLQFGRSVLTGGLTLALLILPVVIVTTRESIRAIPNTIREAAFALGATRWQTIWDHILPYSAGGIITGVIVSLSRAIGETAPLVTIGALTYIAFLPDFGLTKPFDWLFSPFTVLPIQMFNWVSRPDEAFQVVAAAAGIIIIVLTMIMNGIAIYLRYMLRSRIKW